MKPTRLRCTVAVDVCDKSTLHHLAAILLFDGQPALYSGNLGIALVNPLDKYYNKSIGRKRSVEKAKPVEYHLMAVEPFESGTTYKFLVGDASSSPIHINFFVKHDSQVVHVSFVNVMEIKRR